MRDVTWVEVGREAVRAPVEVDQKWMCLSAVPPPVARREDCQGDQAIALTAAVWFLLVHLATPRGVPSSFRIEAPIRPLDTLGLLLFS